MILRAQGMKLAPRLPVASDILLGWMTEQLKKQTFNRRDEAARLGY